MRKVPIMLLQHERPQEHPKMVVSLVAGHISNVIALRALQVHVVQARGNQRKGDEATGPTIATEPPKPVNRAQNGSFRRKPHLDSPQLPRTHLHTRTRTPNAHYTIITLSGDAD